MGKTQGLGFVRVGGMGVKTKILANLGTINNNNNHPTPLLSDSEWTPQVLKKVSEVITIKHSVGK